MRISTQIRLLAGRVHLSFQDRQCLRKVLLVDIVQHHHFELLVQLREVHPLFHPSMALQEGVGGHWVEVLSALVEEEFEHFSSVVEGGRVSEVEWV